jgi:hypothetical protein
MDRAPRVVKFIKAELDESAGKCRARVELKHLQRGDRSYFGTAEASCDEPENLRAVAQATANALLQAAGTEGDAAGYEIRVNQLAVQDAFGKQCVLVSVAGMYFKQTRDLLGVCVIENDPVRSAALAVLNAANRFLGVG